MFAYKSSIVFLPEWFVYTEFGSKNHSGGVNYVNKGNVVSIVATNLARCHVQILIMYFS